MQPTFNPWLGYFDLIDYSDKFVFLDTVQLNKRSWQTRNKLKINKQEYMFSIPIKHQDTRDNNILSKCQISYDNFDFKDKLYELIIRNYKKADHFNNLIDKLEQIIKFDTKYLSQYNINFIISIAKLLNYDTQFIMCSDLKDIHHTKAELILNINQQMDTKIYASPIGSKTYLDEISNKFHENNIAIQYQEYQHPMYKQISDTFIPYLGIIDLLLNEGLENSKTIIKQGRNFIKG
jgi:hypothetical protein